MVDKTPDEIIASAIFYPRKPNPVHQIMIDGKLYHFEWSAMFGPLPMTKTGRVRELGHKHKLWTVTGLWARQGKRVGADGLCIWDPPAKIRVRHMGGRHWLVITDDNEPPHPKDKWIDED